jgi:hypothetical protein
MQALSYFLLQFGHIGSRGSELCLVDVRENPAAGTGLLFMNLQSLAACNNPGASVARHSRRASEVEVIVHAHARDVAIEAGRGLNGARIAD